jgi:hypothetical protein
MSIILRKVRGISGLTPLLRASAGSFGAGAASGSVERTLVSFPMLAVIAIALFFAAFIAWWTAGHHIAQASPLTVMPLMGVIQTGQNVTVSWKAQGGLGSPASGAGGKGVRFNKGSPGLEFEQAVIENDESRSDGMSTKGRLGSGVSQGSFTKNLMVGDSNEWLAGILRNTAVATFDITQASVLGGSAAVTSITTTTSTIVGAAGSFLLQGLRKGMKIKLTGQSTAANNGKWFRVVNVTATVITVAGTPLTADAVADSSFTITVAKTITNGTTEQYGSVEQWDQIISVSELFTDVKVTKMELSWSADGNATVTFTFMGLDGQTTGAQVLTGPTYTTTLPLVLADGTVRINGIDYTVITDLKLTLDCGGSTGPTNSTTRPDVFLDNMKVSGSFQAHKQDSAFFAAARAETTVDIFVDFVEREADPKDFISFYLGNVTLGKASAPVGNTGPRTLSVPFFSGKDEAGGANAATMVMVSTSV